MQSINDCSKRLDAIEKDGETSKLAHDQDLSQLKQITDKLFAGVAKQIEKLEQNQARQSRKDHDKNLAHRVEDLLGKIQLLEDKSTRQATRLQHQQTSKSCSLNLGHHASHFKETFRKYGTVST
jgi:hypothetical protein